jgi:hypothetical protein
MTIFATSTGRNFDRVFHYQCQLVEGITVKMHIFFLDPQTLAACAQKHISG